MADTDTVIENAQGRHVVETRTIETTYSEEQIRKSLHRIDTQMAELAVLRSTWQRRQELLQ